MESFTQPEHKDALEFVGWELIGVISQPVVVDEFESDAFQECNKILKIIAERCSAKEVCIGILEQLETETTCNLNKFVALLEALQIAIDRLKERKSKLVGMVLPSITQYIRGIQLTDEIVDQNESGSKLPAVQCIMKHVLDFLRPFVQEVSMSSSLSENPSPNSYITSLKTDITKCLIQLLDYPLVLLDLTKDGKEMMDSDDEDSESDSKNQSASEISPYRQFAQEIMQFIQVASGSYLYLMEYIWKNNQREETKTKAVNGNVTPEEKLLIDEVEQGDKLYPMLGLSCFAYLLLVEEMEDTNFPAVFSFRYLLRINMKSIDFLLNRMEHCAIYKGLELLDTLSKRLKEKSLMYSHNEFKDITDIVKALINVMTMCSSKKLRLKGVRILPNLVSKLDTRSQYGLLYTILQDCSHPGVAGLLIYLLKEQVNQAFSSSVDEAWFQGSRLMSILQLVFKPPAEAGTEKDLVQETDRIMAALNCLRFILLRDQSDKTKVWQNFTAIEKDFMEPLRQALKVTRIQYQAELANKRDEMAGNKSKEAHQGIEFSVKSRDGSSLGLMPLSDQCEALQSGLYSLDMMESVLARISEIANSRARGGK